MESIKINGHELTGEDLPAIAAKILQGRTTYEKLPWMQALQQDLRSAAGDNAAKTLLKLLTEPGHPYHFGFLSSREYDREEVARLQELIK